MYLHKIVYNWQVHSIYTSVQYILKGILMKIMIYINSLILFINSFLGINFMPKGYVIDAEKAETTITASAEKRIQEGTLTGAHAIVFQNGKKIINKTFGLYAVGGKELDDNAVYRIASMTKPITALALLIEHDRGHLSIYDNLTKYMPEFGEMYISVKDENGNPITDKNGLMKKGIKAENEIKLYQLVSHVSGVGDVNISDIGKDKCTCKTAAEWLSTQPLIFEPGSMQQYSTGAFDVAARVIEITSGMEFSEYIRVNIFEKLGMTDTTFEPNDNQWSRMVGLHNFADGKAFNEKTNPGCVFGTFPTSYHAAGGALASTANDYIKFAQMLLNGGKAEDGTVILSEDTLKLMSTPVPDDKRTGDNRWGLGVRVIVKPGNTLPVGSFGWSGAYGTHFWVDPMNKVAAVYMKNSAYDGGAGNQSASEFEADIMNSFKFKKIK